MGAWARSSRPAGRGVTAKAARQGEPSGGDRSANPCSTTPRWPYRYGIGVVTIPGGAEKGGADASPFDDIVARPLPEQDDHTFSDTVTPGRSSPLAPGVSRASREGGRHGGGRDIAPGNPHRHPTIPTIPGMVWDGGIVGIVGIVGRGRASGRGQRDGQRSSERPMTSSLAIKQRGCSQRDHLKTLRPARSPGDGVRSRWPLDDAEKAPTWRWRPGISS